MGGHDDQVAAARLRRGDDRLGGQRVLDQDRFDRDAAPGRRLPGRGEQLFGGPPLAGGVVVIGHCGKAAVEPGIDRQALGHGDEGDLGAEALGQGKSLVDALAGKLGAVGGNEDVLVHGASLLGPASRA